MFDDFDAAREALQALCARMDARTGLLSTAHYFGHRMSESEHREAAEAREAQERDLERLRRIVAWALEHHRPALRSWGAEAAAQELSESYSRGWARILEQWSAGDGSVGEPGGPPALWWLVTFWRRSVAPKTD